MTPEQLATGKEKVIKTQLDNTKRAKLAELQGVHESLYEVVDPLLLPEVLSLWAVIMDMKH